MRRISIVFALVTLIATISVATTMTMVQADPTTITLISGNGALGTPDPTITMLIGPVNAPFNAAFVPADFASAIAPPSAQIVTLLDFAWVPNPGPNGEQWIADSVASGVPDGTTGLYAQPFTVDCFFGVDSASLLFDYVVDDHLGDASNEGLFVNGNPVIGSKDLAFGNWLVNKQSGPFDITSDVQLGANHLFVYQADTGGPAGIQYSATITYECETGIEKTLVEGPEEIGIYSPGPTPYQYTIVYTGPAALVKDTVPAEFEVISLVATDGTADDFKPGKGPKSQSSTKIEWLVPAGTNTLTVDIQTVKSPGHGKKTPDVFKPTSCGPLPINDGATAFEVDENGDLVLVEVTDPTTGDVTLEPVVIVGPSNSLEVEAVAGAKSCND